MSEIEMLRAEVAALKTRLAEVERERDNLLFSGPGTMGPTQDEVDQAQPRRRSGWRR